jgi:hypothetical protein
MSLILRIKYPDQTPEVVELLTFPAYVGRSSSNDVVVRDDTVSARHAVIERKGSGYMIQDLTSSNGIWRSGKRENSFRLNDKLEFQLGDLKVEALFDDDGGGTRSLHVEADGSRWLRLRANFKGDFAPWLAGAFVIFLIQAWINMRQGGDPVEDAILSLLFPLFFILPLASGFSLFKSPMPKSHIIATAAVRLLPMSQLVLSGAQVIEYLSYYWGGQVVIAAIYSIATGALALFGAQSAFVLARIAKQTALAVGTVLILFSVLTTLLPALPTKFDLTGMKERVPIFRPAESGPSRLTTTVEFLEKVDASVERLEKARPVRERLPVGG